MPSAAPLASGIYEGWVRHRRLGPAARGGQPRAFHYPLFMMYLDLDELESVFDGRWLWSTQRPAVARWRREDYLGDPSVPVREAVDRAVRDALGRGVEGPVRMLTHLRYFGYCFNPVTFYYVFAPDGRTLDAVVAEITNTPWGERHVNVLDARDPEANLGSAHTPRFRFAKDFHVSPYLSMDYVYDWSFSTPGRALAVHMENRRRGEVCFDATLTLRRRPIGARELARCLVRFPMMTLQVVVRIYLQALRLRLGGYRFHPHPNPTARIGG